jgi:hypothetical protein
MKSKIWNKDFGTVELITKKGEFDKFMIDQGYSDQIYIVDIKHLEELRMILTKILGEFGLLKPDIEGQKYI